MKTDADKIIELANKSNLIKHGGNSKIHKVKFLSLIFNKDLTYLIKV